MTKGLGERMRMFEKWNELQNKKCKVVINNILFDDQSYDCDMLQIINDEHRIGVVIKGRELFLYKDYISGFWVEGNIYRVKDKIMEIYIIVNKM